MSKGVILLSVILPTHNRGHCIEKMIDSVLMQDFKNFELIIVDDGSTDGTMEMLKKRYDNTDLRIVYKANEGVSSARNLGISLARGEYITFVDSDDYLLDGFFRDIYESILHYRADVYVYSGFSKQSEKLDKVPLFWGDWRYGDGKVICKHGREFIKDFCLFGGNSWACAKVFKTSLIRGNNLAFEEHISYGEDMLFNLQVYLNSSKIVAIPRGYYVYHISGGGLSRRDLSSQRKVSDLFGAYKILEVHGEYKSFFALNYIRHTRKWLLLSLFQHGLQMREGIRGLYLQLNTSCHQIEKIEAVVAKKSLLCALFTYKILHTLCEIRSRLRFFFGFFYKNSF